MFTGCVIQFILINKKLLYLKGNSEVINTDTNEVMKDSALSLFSLLASSCFFFYLNLERWVLQYTWFLEQHKHPFLFLYKRKKIFSITPCKICLKTCLLEDQVM